MQEDRPEINVRSCWSIIIKRRFIAIAAGLLVMSLFTWGSLLWPKTYEASSTVLVERNSNLYPAAGNAEGTEGIEEKLNILGNALTSRNMVERIIKKLYPGPDAKRYGWLVRDIPKNLEVTTKFSRDRGRTGLFVVKYRGKDPMLVTDVVNALVGEYIDENVGGNRTEAIGDYEFLKSQTLEYKKNLDETDNAIRAFKERNPRLDDARGTALAGKIDALESAKADAEIKLNELMGKREILDRQLSAEKDGASAREGTDARLLGLNNQLIALKARYTDDYPEVRKIYSEIAELRNQSSGGGSPNVSPAYQQLLRQVADTDTEIAALRARIRGISSQEGARNGLEQAPLAQEQWARLQRDRNVYEKIYDDLMQKLGSAGASKEFELARKSESFKVVDPAVLPNSPVKPNTLLFMVLGIFLGAASGIGAAVLLENRIRPIEDEETIEARFSLPVLATIQATEEDTITSKADITAYIGAGIYFSLLLTALANELLYRYMHIRLIGFLTGGAG